MRLHYAILAATVAATLGAPAATALDVGESLERKLHSQSKKLFGFGKPLANSATAADVIPRESATAAQRQFLAEGLTATFVTRKVGGLGDMIAFWPDDINYSHLIVCNEWARSPGNAGVNGGRNPSVQRINVNTGQVNTILYGMSRCDGIRTTQWGTVLATEETGGGAAYEILDPLTTTGHWIFDRGAAGAAADIRDAFNGLTPSTKIVKRTALVSQAWEGLEVMHTGVVIGGDELRPGEGTPPAPIGGSIYRFVPDTFYNCIGAPVRPGQMCDNTIADLSQSPLASGRNFALVTVCDGNTNHGQGCEYGTVRWVEVGAATARADAFANGATGYCRPEDLHIDRGYGIFNGGEGIRWLWNNTCGGGGGETLEVIESTAATLAKDTVSVNIGAAGNKNFLANGTTLATALMTRFVENDAEMNSHDNLDIQPRTGNVYIIEDNDFGDIWSCLPDGNDRDFRTDGCVRMLSIRDPDAEPTGFIFDGTGRVAYYIVQHGQQPASLLDFTSNPFNGNTDDLIRITGFRVRDVGNLSNGRSDHDDD
jgi:hypothetical protein